MPGLTFNSLASNYGSQRLGFWNRESEGQDPVYVSEGPNPVYVDIRRIDGNVSEQNSLMYRISLLNRYVEEDETPYLKDYDLSGTDFPAGTPVTLTINYESDDPRYFIVSGSEVSGYKNRYPDSWLGTPRLIHYQGQDSRSCSFGVGRHRINIFHNCTDGGGQILWWGDL